MLTPEVVWAGIAGGTGPNYSAADKGTTNAEIYDPLAPAGQKWKPVADAQIWRMYHSTAFLTVNAEARAQHGS